MPEDALLRVSSGVVFYSFCLSFPVSQIIGHITDQIHHGQHIKFRYG